MDPALAEGDVDLDAFADFDFLDVSIVPATCSEDSPVSGFGGGEGFVLGDAYVSIFGMADDAALEEVRASIAPTTVEALIAAAAAEGPGSWFAYAPTSLMTTSGGSSIDIEG